jgi:large subunit ribosomal protein L1
MNKRMSKAYALVDQDQTFSVNDAVRKVYNFPAPNFTQSINLTIQIINRAPKDKEVLRGSTLLPHGTGKTPKIAIFAAEGEVVNDADKITLDDISKPDFKARMAGYDKCGATTAGLTAAVKAASVIGPMGLMPTAKNNTVMANPSELVEFLRNAILFVEKDRHIRTTVGVASMTTEHVAANAQHIISTVLTLAGKEKRNIFGKIYLSGTMTPAVPVQMH